MAKGNTEVRRHQKIVSVDFLTLFYLFCSFDFIFDISTNVKLLSLIAGDSVKKKNVHISIKRWWSVW